MQSLFCTACIAHFEKHRPVLTALSKRAMLNFKIDMYIIMP